MKLKIKTTITFINKNTKETRTESFYSGMFERTEIDAEELYDAVYCEKRYWKHNIEKLGGHKVLSIDAYLIKA